MVFVNFWLQWVKKEMKGKGYVMSSSNAERTPEQAWERQKEEAEGIGGGGQ